MEKIRPIPLKAHSDVSNNLIEFAELCGMSPNDFANRCIKEVLAAAETMDSNTPLGIIRLIRHLRQKNLSSMDRLVFSALYKMDSSFIDKHAKFRELLIAEWMKSPNMAPSAYPAAYKAAVKRFDSWKKEQKAADNLRTKKDCSG